MAQTTNVLKMFPVEAEEFAKKLDNMAEDYRSRGDTESARNCEAKARELRA